MTRPILGVGAGLAAKAPTPLPWWGWWWVTPTHMTCPTKAIQPEGLWGIFLRRKHRTVTREAEGWQQMREGGYRVSQQGAVVTGGRIQEKRSAVWKL